MIERLASDAPSPVTHKERIVFELKVLVPAYEIARNTFELSLEKPKEFEFRAGQSMKFFPKEEYAGSFSLVCAPEENKLVFAFRGSDSELKRRMRALTVGDSVPIRDVKRVNDTFHYPEEVEKGIPVVMIAGGIGITPFSSMLRHAYITGDKRPFTLLHVNPTNRDVAYREEIVGLRERGVILETRYVFTGEKDGVHTRRRFGVHDVAPFTKEPYPIFYVAGPEGMVQETVTLLGTLGVPEEKIRYKEFTGYVGKDDVNR